MSKDGKILIGYKGVKYGLQKRKKPNLPKPGIFGEDSSSEEDTSISKQVAREQEQQLKASKVARAQEAALAEDSTVFEYDTVYDEIQKRKLDPRRQDLVERKPKYIQALKQKAEIRKKEQDIAYERRLLKERKADDHLYTQKEAFITEAYKKKLMEDKYWIAREQAMDVIEEKEDVTKKKDLTGFYKNLCTRNVAFGSNQLKEPEDILPEPEPLPEHLHQIVQERINSNQPTPQEQDTQKQDDSQKQDLQKQDNFQEQDLQKQDLQEQDLRGQEVGDSESRKRRRNNEGSIASARERYLARKQAAAQLNL
eukprot:g5130.t1